MPGRGTVVCRPAGIDNDGETIEAILTEPVGRHVVVCRAVFDRRERVAQGRHIARLDDRDVVRRQRRIDVAGQAGKPCRRLCVVEKIGSLEMRIQRCEIEGVAGQEHTVVAVQQADRVRCMPGRIQDLESPAAEVDGVALVDEATDRERSAAKILDDEAFRQRLPDPAFLEEFRDGLRLTARRTPARVRGVAAEDRLELVVATDVVVVGV